MDSREPETLDVTCGICGTTAAATVFVEVSLHGVVREIVKNIVRSVTGS